MGNIIFATRCIILFVILVAGCKAAAKKTQPPPSKSSTGFRYPDFQKYQEIDQLITRWVEANTNGDTISLSNFAIELSNKASAEKDNIIKNLEEYEKNPSPDMKGYVLISAVLAGFTNDCTLNNILHRYLLTQSSDKELLSNVLLGISILSRCPVDENTILNILSEEAKDTVILNAFQVLLTHTITNTEGLDKVVNTYLKHRNPLIQNQVIRTIAKYKLAKYTKILVDEFLYNPLTYIRTNTAIALSIIGDRSIVGDLIDKINQPSFVGKKEAVYVLENLTGQKFGLDSQAWLFWYLEHSK